MASGWLYLNKITHCLNQTQISYFCEPDVVRNRQKSSLKLGLTKIAPLTKHTILSFVYQ